MGIDLFDFADPNAANDDLSNIKIDADFARRFEHNKKRESLQKLAELKKKGLASDSSDSDPSDSDSDLLEPSKDDLHFYSALLKVKKQDPILQSKDVKLFDDEEEEEGPPNSKPTTTKKEKPMYLKDVMAKHLLEEGPDFDDSKLKYDSKIYKKDQADDIRAFLEAEKAAFGDDDGENIIKEKDNNGEELNEEDDIHAVEISKKLDEYFDEDVNEDEMFLKNYLLKKMWVDKEKKLAVDVSVSEDEDEIERQEKYEAEFNFRHEEVEVKGEGDRILGHARFTEGSVRKKANSRKVQRESKERRAAEREKEMREEVKRLKNLKKREIREKVERIKEVAGIGVDGVCKLDVDDLEEDFDPEEYDRKMRETFGDGYYGAEDAEAGFGSGGEDGDLEKPDFDKEDELLGIPKDWDVCGSKDGFAAARERVLKKKAEEEEEEAEPKEEAEPVGKRKRKRKITLKEKVELDKELEEYYKLDYEGTVGDLKTRFKYKPVPANKYGLGVDEILMADDKDLNQYVSMKKLAPYRPDEWKVTYHQKLKKSAILDGDSSKDGKKVGKKHESETKVEPSEKNDEANEVSRRRKRRLRQAELKLSQSRLMAYGKIPSKPKKKH